MNAEASLRSTHDLGRLVAPPGVGRRRIGSERGMRMSLPWAVGTTLFLVIAWAIGTLLLRWVTLD